MKSTSKVEEGKKDEEGKKEIENELRAKLESLIEENEKLKSKLI